ncbi:MAG: LacI family DNA-binding transcriptional regulator [Oscillospiraceae bacterium]|jgi:transcriptional regulator, lacI family|nr:LacI family DNA-binding transcriptional regulator [Oscillospiraceae bacterium]
MSITQKQIAQKAGVSCATVSRVLRSPSSVRRQLSSQVYAAMRELGVKAQSGELLEETRNDILVVVNDFTYSLYGEFITGISNIAAEKGMSITLCNSCGNLSVERNAVNNACRGGYVGIIFVTAEDTTEYREMVAQATIPIVFLNRKIEGLDYDSVLLSHFETARIAVRRLLEEGHQKIAMLSTDIDSTNTRAEKAGFIDALLESGVPYTAAHSGIFYYPNTYRGGYDFACRFNLEKLDYSALYVISSEQTVGLIWNSIQEPKGKFSEVKILALNRSKVLLGQYPNLITMEQPVQEMGRKAVEVLLERAAAPNRDRMNVQYNALFEKKPSHF